MSTSVEKKTTRSAPDGSNGPHVSTCTWNRWWSKGRDTPILSWPTSARSLRPQQTGCNSLLCERIAMETQQPQQQDKQWYLWVNVAISGLAPLITYFAIRSHVANDTEALALSWFVPV